MFSKYFYSLKQELANYGQCNISVLINKVLLRHSYAPLSVCYLWLLLYYRCTVKQLQMACKIWNIYFLNLSRKHLPTPGLEYYSQDCPYSLRFHPCIANALSLSRSLGMSTLACVLCRSKCPLISSPQQMIVDKYP